MFSLTNVIGKLTKLSTIEKAKGTATEKKIKAIFEFEEVLENGIARIKITVEFDNKHDAESLVVNKPYTLTLTPEPDLDDYAKEAAEP